MLSRSSPSKSPRPALIEGGRGPDSTYKWEAQYNQIVKKWKHQARRDLWILKGSLQSFPRILAEGSAVSFPVLLVSNLWHYPALVSHPAVFYNHLRGAVCSWAARQGLNKHNPLISVCPSFSDILPHLCRGTYRSSFWTTGIWGMHGSSAAACDVMWLVRDCVWWRNVGVGKKKSSWLPSWICLEWLIKSGCHQKAMPLNLPCPEVI